MTIAEVIAEDQKRRADLAKLSPYPVRLDLLGWACATPDLPPDERAEHWRSEAERRQRSRRP